MRECSVCGVSGGRCEGCARVVQHGENIGDGSSVLVSMGIERECSAEGTCVGFEGVGIVRGPLTDAASEGCGWPADDPAPLSRLQAENDTAVQGSGLPARLRSSRRDSMR